MFTKNVAQAKLEVEKGIIPANQKRITLPIPPPKATSKAVLKDILQM
jgi:hypothetical protein